jgi:hypothetical protein
MQMRRTRGASGHVDMPNTSRPRRGVAPGDGGVTMGVPNRTDVGSGCVAAASRRCAPGDAGNALGLKSASDERVVRRVVRAERAERGRGVGRTGRPGTARARLMERVRERRSGGDRGVGGCSSARRALRRGGHSSWPETAGARAIAKVGGEMEAGEVGGEGGDEGRCPARAP